MRNRNAECQVLVGTQFNAASQSFKRVLIQDVVLIGVEVVAEEQPKLRFFKRADAAFDVRSGQGKIVKAQQHVRSLKPGADCFET